MPVWFDRKKRRRKKRWAPKKIWIDRCHLDRNGDVTRRRQKSFLVSWFNIKLLPFSLQILRISILSLHGRNFNLWSVITNCTRLFRPPLAFHLFSSSFLRFFLCKMLSASIVRRLLRRIFFSSATIGFRIYIRMMFREDELIVRLYSLMNEIWW